MEGLFGLLIILYVVGAVVGAVLKRMQQGPILDQPVLIPPAKPGEKQPTKAPKQGEMDDVVVAPTVAESPTIDGQPVETFKMNEETARFDEDTDGFSLDDKADESMARENWDQGQPRKPKSSQGPSPMPTEATFRNVDLSTANWRQAVVLAEVLGRPRGLKPYSLPYKR